MGTVSTRIIDYQGEDEEGNRKFVVLVPKSTRKDDIWNPSLLRVVVAHDYVRFVAEASFQMERIPNGEYPAEGDFAANWIHGGICDITINIRDMIDLVLPYLNNHHHLQKDHIKDREYSDTDQSYKDYDLDEPRWKKGDLYPAYAFTASAIQLYDTEQKTPFVHIRRIGEKIWEKVAVQTYQKIKKGLQLYKYNWEFQKETKK